MGPPGRAGPRLGGRLPAHPCTASEARPPASRPGLSDSSCVPVASRARTAVSSGILPHPHALRMQFLCPSRLFCVPNSSSLKTVLNFTFCWWPPSQSNSLLLLSASPVAQGRGKESTCQCRTPGLIPVIGRCPEEGSAAPSSILAWGTPWTEEPGEPQSPWLQRVGLDWGTQLQPCLQLFC